MTSLGLLFVILVAAGALGAAELARRAASGRRLEQALDGLRSLGDQLGVDQIALDQLDYAVPQPSQAAVIAEAGNRVKKTPTGSTQATTRHAA